MTTINLDMLNELQAINKKLVSGYHISEQDTTLWQELDQQIDSYQALFSALNAMTYSTMPVAFTIWQAMKARQIWGKFPARLP